MANRTSTNGTRGPHPYTHRGQGRENRRHNERTRFATARCRCDDDCFLEGPVCLPGIDGECLEQSQQCCSAGQHPRTASYPEVPDDWQAFACISRAKMQLLQTKWQEAGGCGYLLGAWQVPNKRLDRLFRATAHNLQHELGRTSDMIDGWHGTSEQNIVSIARHGFDTSRRSGQAYGAGEYFAKNPQVSLGYCRGGAFMFLCKLLLGEADVHHTWVDEMKYYVVKQYDGMVQALPVYLVQFQPTYGSLIDWLSNLSFQCDTLENGTLQHRQRGGQTACTARPDAGMTAESTSFLWLGWLAPELAKQSDDAIEDDIIAFLEGVKVEQVVPERNGARVGAFVRLANPVSKSEFEQLADRRYHDKFRISVDDVQPNNPRCAGKACPRLTGPSKYCRGWNIGGHHAWNWGCPFDHPLELRPTHNASYTMELLQPHSAKYDEIESALMQSAPFHNGMPRIVGIHRVVNQALEEMYEKRRNFLTQKHGFAVEKELWHGTSCKAIDELLTHGLQPPSDMMPSEDCPVSGGKGLCTSLCSSACKHCRDPHAWNKCHMYGLGVYLADMAQKSHRYVRAPELRAVNVGTSAPSSGVGATIRGTDGEIWGRVIQDNGNCWLLESGRIAKKATEGIRWDWVVASRHPSYGVGAYIVGADWSSWGRVVNDEGTCWRLESGRIAKKETEGIRWWWDEAGDSSEPSEQLVHSMLWCRVCLGSPYLIEGNLLGASSMHDVCWCQDPSEQLETVADEWNVASGHDAYYVRGLSGAQRAGLGVYNSEYIIFQPYQVLPLYRVDYIIE